MHRSGKMHNRLGLKNGTWIDNIAGEDSHLALAEAEVCADYIEMEALRQEYFEQGKDRSIGNIGRRMKTISDEPALNFLSRKAVIPKYGFPWMLSNLMSVPATAVPPASHSSGICPRRSPSTLRAARWSPTNSSGNPSASRQFPARHGACAHYEYDDARNFRQWNEDSVESPSSTRKYLIPEFGFVTSLFKKPSEPQRRAHRLYTTRPFFPGFDARPESNTILGVQVTRPFPEFSLSCARAGTQRASTYAAPAVDTGSSRKLVINRHRIRTARAPWSGSLSATN